MSQSTKLIALNADASTRVCGLAERTQSAQASGLAWYDEYASIANEPALSEMTVEDVSGDNGRELIVRYMLWLAKSKLQKKNAKKDNAESPTTFLAPQSKRKYLENFANHLVSTYGSHPDVYGLTGEVYAVWWKKLKQSFDNIATRDSFTDNLRDYKTKAIYRLVDHMQCFQLHDKGSEFLNLDLNSILKAMLKDASSNYDLAMYRLLIALTYLSVG
jgi:hypothetical protein